MENFDYPEVNDLTPVDLYMARKHFTDNTDELEWKSNSGFPYMEGMILVEAPVSNKYKPSTKLPSSIIREINTALESLEFKHYDFFVQNASPSDLQLFGMSQESEESENISDEDEEHENMPDWDKLDQHMMFGRGGID